MALFAALCMVAGILVNGRIDGVLIDDRNRISLERAQWVAWLIVLLGGYFVEAVWNVAHGAAFPKMEPELFGLLGIVSVSPVISNIIVDSKKQPTAAPAAPAAAPPAAGAAPAGPAPVPAVAAAPAAAPPTETAPPQQLAAGDNPLQQGSMDVNATPAEASWKDLYLGEEVANRYVVDISRLQKLIITVLLVFAYMASLWTLLGHATVAALDMPDVGRDFLALLGISHGAYLASKTTTKTPT
jgi:hypothetical protein